MSGTPKEYGGGADGRAPLVELLYFEGCPNHTAFLPRLEQLLHDAGIHAAVQLVEVGDDEQAQRLRFLGSPSLRVDGRDVDPTADGRHDYGLQCRIYPGANGPAGTPPDEWVRRALPRS